MKNHLIRSLCSIATLFTANFTFAQINDYCIGQIHTLHSEILNEDRILNINLPDSFDMEKSYPVWFVLDGSRNEDFLHLVGLFQFFRLQFQMPEVIVVGISNVDRKRDFTFHTDIKELKEHYPSTGHSDSFIRFLEEELQPYIDRTFHTTKDKYLIGQSLGGLLATEVLLKKPKLFNHYFIISPSLWWDEESLLKDAPKLLEENSPQPDFVYVSVGADEHKIMRKDAKALYQKLKESLPSKTRLIFNKMKEENHASILHNSIYEGLEILYPMEEAQ
ncbi:MAG: alpha/beta hydrolase-fold protein [Saprospiraceae bacterium]